MLREKYRLVASRMYPSWNPNPQARYVAGPGIDASAFWCTRQCSNQLSHLARAHALIFKFIF